MRSGIENRVPFLDHRLVKIMNEVSPKFKSGISEISVKRLLKRISKKYLPDRIINRKKYGFTTSISQMDTKMTKALPKLYSNLSDDFNLKGTNLFLIYNLSVIGDIFSN